MTSPSTTFPNNHQKNTVQKRNLVENFQAKNSSLKAEAKQKVQELIGNFEHTPEFLRKNGHIRTGYRINFNTTKRALKSLFMIHNETVNIWSHLAGSIFLLVFCGVLCFSATPFLGQSTTIPSWPIIVFLLTAIFCLTCSALYHLFCCLSPTTYKLLLRLDHAGITILIAGSCFPPLIYGFFCHPFFSTFYLTIIGVSSSIVFFITLGDKIYTKEYHKFKTLMYLGLAVFAALPIVHLVYISINETNPGPNLDFSTSAPCYLAAGASYIVGLTSYIARCPERYYPGRFDICGHGHQILHICDLLGIMFTYFGAVDNYYNRIGNSCM